MELEYLKLRIDTKAEYEEVKKQYEYKRRELKKAEIRNVFGGFKDFFRADKSFKFKSNDHSVTAQYKEYCIILDMDIYKNIDSEDFVLTGCIRTYEKENFEFTVEGIPNKDILQPAHIDNHEKMIHDIRYYKDFLKGEIYYTFEYRIKGREEHYASMKELMHAL